MVFDDVDEPPKRLPPSVFVVSGISLGFALNWLLDWAGVPLPLRCAVALPAGFVLGTELQRWERRR